MPNCVECSAKIDRKYGDIVDCYSCKNSFHISCVNLSVDELNVLSRENKEWNCKNCASKSKYDFVKLMKAFEDMSAFMKDMSNYMKGRFDEIQVSINCIQSLKEDNLALKAENKDLKERISVVEYQLDKFEETSRSNILEINGVPVIANENVLDIVKNICESGLGMNVDNNQIQNCFRLKSNKKDSKNPGKIIVLCANKEMRDHIIKLRRDKKHNNLNAKTLGFPTNEKIFINQSLTSYKRDLLFKANLCRKDGKCKYVWVRDGNIMIRKEEGGKIIYIKSSSDLDKI